MKVYTEKQIAFVDHLFGDAMGNAVRAKEMAGYFPTFSTANLVKSVEDLILERTKQYLVQNGPKAVISLISVLDDPVQLGVNHKINVARDILDRIGVQKTEKMEVAGGVFVLPPKDEE